MAAIDPSKLINSFESLATWGVFVIVAVFGSIGGIAHMMTAPSDDKTPWYQYVIVGAVASLAALFVFSPNDDPVRLVALAIVAGYGGKAILDALESKVQTAIAQAEISNLKDQGQKAIATGKDAVALGQQMAQAANAAHPALLANTSVDKLAELGHRLDTLGESFQ